MSSSRIFEGSGGSACIKITHHFPDGRSTRQQVCLYSTKKSGIDMHHQQFRI
jgi:hypothetical protein